MFAQAFHCKDEEMDLAETSYHGGISESGLGELLGLEQLCLEASFEDARVSFFQNTVESFPKNQVCVLNTQHVLRGCMKQTVPISYRQESICVFSTMAGRFCTQDRKFSFCE